MTGRHRIYGFVAGGGACALIGCLPGFASQPPTDAGTDAGKGPDGTVIAEAEAGETGPDATAGDAVADQSVAEAEAAFDGSDGGGVSDAGGDAPACPDGQAGCNGVCTDMATDPANCGGCGHACGQSTAGVGHCMASECQPFALVDEPLGGLLFADGTAVYGTAGGVAEAIAAGNGSTLATGTAPITGLLAQSTSSLIAFGTSPGLPAGTTGQGVFVIPKGTLQGSTQVPVGSANDVSATVYAAAVTSQAICFLFSQESSPMLYSWSLSGGSVVGVSNAPSLGGDATGVVYFYPSTSTGIQLFSTGPDCATDSPTALPIPTNLSNYLGGTLPQFSIATDATNAYFRNPADGLLYRAARNASGFSSMTGSALANPTFELAVDDADVYWTDTTAGTVSQIAITASGATPTVIASGQSGVTGIAVDDTAVYWASRPL
jgi:hypothetical protein